MDAHANRRTPAQRSGDAAEDAALAHLQAHGLRPLARNVRFKMGELDLVMQDGATVVFVEVRRRSNAGYGSGLDSIDRRKAMRLARAAEAWRQRNPRFAAFACRFDVVAFTAELDAPLWVRAAFTLDDLG